MQTPFEMKEKIMKRVYGVYVIRQLTQPAVRVAVFGAACLIVAALVSVRSVISNVEHVHGKLATLKYVFFAFMGTEFLVQAGIITAALVLSFSVRDLIVASFRPKSVLA